MLVIEHIFRIDLKKLYGNLEGTGEAKFLIINNFQS